MASEAAKLIARVGADIDPYTKKMAKADQVMKRTAKSIGAEANRMAAAVSGGLGGLAGIAGVGAVAILGKQLVGATFDLVGFGEASERAFGTFNRLVAGEGLAAMESLRVATKRGVSDQQLMAASTMFLTMRLAKSAKQATDMARVSTQLGMAMGVGPTKAMSDFALMLANQAYPRLDLFGMSAGRVRARVAELKTETAGLSTETAFMTAVMEEARLTMQRVGEQEPTSVEKWSAAIANLRLEMGLYVKEAGAMITGGAGVVDAATEGLREYNRFQAILQNQIDTLDAMRGSHLFGAEAAAQLDKHLRSLNNQYVLGRIDIDQLGAAMKAWLPVVPKWVSGFAALQPVIAADSDEMRSLAAFIYEVRSAWRSVKIPSESELAKLAKAQWGYAMGLRAGDPARQIALIEDAQGKINRATLEGQIEWLTLETQRVKLQGGIDKQLESDARAHAAEMLSIRKQYLSRVRSLVQQGLQATQVTRMDILAAEFGQYESKADEYLRRLQAAFETPEGPWGGMLGGRRGKEAEYYLGQQKQAFAQYRFGEMGPGFDYNAMIRALADQVLQAQAMEGRIDQVTADVLALLGGAPGIGQADVMALLDPMAGQGQEGAKVFTTAFDAAMTAQEGQWRRVGQNMARWIGDGLEEGVDTWLLDGFVDALVPKLREALTGVN